jgi:hypothetical protein
VRSALARLAPPQRELLAPRYAAGLSAPEIAAVLGKTDVLHLMIHRLSDDEAWATGHVVETTPARGPYTETAVLLHYVAGTWHEYAR